MAYNGGATTSVSAMTLDERLDAIRKVDDKIHELLKHAQSCIVELAKDKQTTRSKMEDSSTNFKTTLRGIETELASHMQYLSNVCVGSAHQGSTFTSQQNIALAEAAENELHAELFRIAEKHFGERPELPYPRPEVSEQPILTESPADTERVRMERN